MAFIRGNVGHEEESARKKQKEGLVNGFCEVKMKHNQENHSYESQEPF
jgi:hypothetical protein